LAPLWFQQAGQGLTLELVLPFDRSSKATNQEAFAKETNQMEAFGDLDFEEGYLAMYV